MAKKQGLVSDDDFQALLDGVRRVDQDTAWKAEGPDLASPAVEEEVQKESAEETEISSTQPGVRVESEKEPAEQVKGESAQLGVDAILEKEEPKSLKRKLVLNDDPKAEGHKPKRTSKRCLGQEKKKGASETSDTVKISSEDDDTHHDKRERARPKVLAKRKRVLLQNLGRTPN